MKGRTLTLTQMHIAVVALLVICVTAMGIAGTMTSGDVTNVYIACLGSLSGHAIGFQAGKEATGSGGSGKV